jgi:serine/threonine-protein phosphatase PGAM5
MRKTKRPRNKNVQPVVEREPPARLLHFVRHGQYESETSEGRLTALGREQAALVARHFQELPIASVCSSDLPRAVETAEIIARALGLGPVRHHRMLREVVPCRVPGIRIPNEKTEEGKQRIARVVGRLFRAPRRSSQHVVVCHGNLIRALVCKVTGAPLKNFIWISSHNGGVTSFRVTSSGAWLVSYNELGHLPVPLRSHG